MYTQFSKKPKNSLFDKDVQDIDDKGEMIGFTQAELALKELYKSIEDTAEYNDLIKFIEEF